MKTRLTTIPPNPCKPGTLGYRIFEEVATGPERSSNELAELFGDPTSTSHRRKRAIQVALWTICNKKPWMLGSEIPGGPVTFFERTKEQAHKMKIAKEKKVVKPMETNPLKQLLEDRVVALKKLVEWKSGSLKSSADLLSSLDSFIMTVIQL